MKISKGTLIRTLCLVLTIINSALTIFGKSPLPIEDETIAEIVSYALTTAASLAAWWKNNSFTSPAIKADKVLAELKAEKNKGAEE